MFEIIHHIEAKKTEIAPGVFKTPKTSSTALEILELELAPGAALQPHDMPSRVTFFVLEGIGTFTYADSKVQIPAGDMVVAPTGQIRFWANHETTPLRILVIKSLTEK